jgi:hypothetical protein
LPQYSGRNFGVSGSLSSLRSRFPYAFLVSSLILSRLTELVFVDAFSIANCLSCGDQVTMLAVTRDEVVFRAAT